MGVATTRREAVVLDEQSKPHVTGKFGRSSLSVPLVALQFECHGIAHGARDEVNKSSVAPKNGSEGILVAGEDKNLAR